MGHEQLKGRQGRPCSQALGWLLLLDAQQKWIALPGAGLPGAVLLLGAGWSQGGCPLWRRIGADAVAQLYDGRAQGGWLVSMLAIGLFGAGAW